MASIKLTKDLRQTISDNVITNLLKDRRKAHKDKGTAFNRKLADWYIGEKNLATMKQLPLTYFGSRQDLSICEPNQGRNRIVICGNDTVRMPADVSYGRIEVPMTHALWKEARALEAEIEKCNEDQNELRTKVDSMLAGVNTVAALLLAWPEASVYLPAFEEKKDLPAIRAEELNGFISGLKK